ncbi:reverse transcriptase domain-containing protein [Tanacetum coccineum]
MAREDEEKTAFYTDQGTYCYTKKPFGLKNVGATYHRLVDTAFQSQIKRNLEAYVDDMVIKSKDEKMLLADIVETFNNLRKINMKLNPNKVLLECKRAKRNYAPLKKLVISLVHMTRRLRRYFEAHPVKVITDQPIKQILNKAEASGKLAKYAIELGTYNITFEPRNAIKGQILADFISETPDKEPADSYFQMPKMAPEEYDTGRWTLFTDRASNLKGSGAGLVLIGPSGIEHTYTLRLTFTSTNNKAEYEALLAGLRIARKMKVQDLKVKVDYKLVASQINGSYVASSNNMIKYLSKAKEYIAFFKSFSIKNNARNLNQKVDIHQNKRNQRRSGRRRRPLDDSNRSIPVEGDLAEILKGDLAERQERKAQLTSKNQPIRDERRGSIQKGILGPLVEVCRPTSSKFYHQRDTYRGLRNALWTASGSKEGHEAGLLKTLMTSIMAPWPFYQLGMDIVGTIPQASGKVKFLIVAIDYFTKWVEAKPLARIAG